MDLVLLIVRIVLSLSAGFLAGWGTVYVFNRVPAKWLCDYGEEPDKEMWGTRIHRYPWGWVLSFLFIGAIFLLWEQGPLYQLAGTPALWFLFLVALADVKYRIIPDQFIIAIATAAVGFIPFQSDMLSPLYGALIGGGSFLLIGIVGRWILKREVMGFGDIKLLAVIGLLAGMKGTIIILIMTIFSSGTIMGIRLLARQVKKDEEQPLGPYIAACTAAFILFRPWLLFLADCYMGSINY